MHLLRLISFSHAKFTRYCRSVGVDDDDDVIVFVAATLFYVTDTQCTQQTLQFPSSTLQTHIYGLFSLSTINLDTLFFIFLAHIKLNLTVDGVFLFVFTSFLFESVGGAEISYQK